MLIIDYLIIKNIFIMPKIDFTTDSSYSQSGLNVPSTINVEHGATNRYNTKKEKGQHHAQEENTLSASDEVLYNYDDIPQNKKLYHKAFKDPDFLDALNQENRQLSFYNEDFIAQTNDEVELLENELNTYLSKRKNTVNIEDIKLLKTYFITGKRRDRLILESNSFSQELETTKRMLAYSQKKQEQLVRKKIKQLTPVKSLLFKSRRNKRRITKLSHLEDLLNKHSELSQALATKTDYLTTRLNKIESDIEKEAIALNTLKDEAVNKEKVYKLLSEIHQSKNFKKTLKEEKIIDKQTKDYTIALNLKNPAYNNFYFNNYKPLSTKKFTAFFKSNTLDAIKIATEVIKYNIELDKLLRKKQAHVTSLNALLKAGTSENDLQNRINNNIAIREVMPQLIALQNNKKQAFETHIAIRLTSHKKLNIINQKIKDIKNGKTRGKHNLIPLIKEQKKYESFNQALDKHIETLAESKKAIDKEIEASKITLISNLKYQKNLPQVLKNHHNDRKKLLQELTEIASDKKILLDNKNDAFLQEKLHDLVAVNLSNASHNKKLIKQQNIINFSNKQTSHLHEDILLVLLQKSSKLSSNLEDFKKKIKNSVIKAFLTTHIDDIIPLQKKAEKINDLKIIIEKQENLINSLTINDNQNILRDYFTKNPDWKETQDDDILNTLDEKIAILLNPNKNSDQSTAQQLETIKTQEKLLEKVSKNLQKKLAINLSLLYENNRIIEKECTSLSYKYPENNFIKAVLSNYMMEAFNTFKTSRSEIYKLSKINNTNFKDYRSLVLAQQKLEAQILSENTKLLEIIKDIDNIDLVQLEANADIISKNQKKINEHISYIQQNKHLEASLKLSELANSIMINMAPKKNNTDQNNSINELIRFQENFIEIIAKVEAVEDFKVQFFANINKDALALDVELRSSSLKEDFEKNFKNILEKAQALIKAPNLQEDINTPILASSILYDLIIFNEPLESIKNYEFVSSALKEQLQNDYTQLMAKAKELIKTPNQEQDSLLDDALATQANLDENLKKIKQVHENIIFFKNNEVEKRFETLISFGPLNTFEDLNEKYEQSNSERKKIDNFYNSPRVETASDLESEPSVSLEAEITSNNRQVETASDLKSEPSVSSQAETNKDTLSESNNRFNLKEFTTPTIMTLRQRPDITKSTTTKGSVFSKKHHETPINRT
jgi:hypothetical protein